jgi:hypothetical protein
MYYTLHTTILRHIFEKIDLVSFKIYQYEAKKISDKFYVLI